MHRRALDVLGCPECRGPFRDLVPGTEPVEAGSMRCGAGHEYPIEGGIPFLVVARDRQALRGFADSYARAWARDGWGSSDVAYLKELPHRDTTGRHRTEWRVKARSMDALLETWEGPGRLRMADLGCGMGWLAHHLAQRGHEVYAVDASLDDAVGLGAAALLSRLGPSFEPIWGDLERPPFRDASLDAVVCNASLHYSTAPGTVLAEVARILRPGGRLAIMNSPVYRDAASARRAEADFRKHLRDVGAGEPVTSRYHHFVRAELEDAVHRTLGPVREIPFDPGLWFRTVRRLKGFALRMELASFPVLVATKPRDSGTGDVEDRVVHPTSPG